MICVGLFFYDYFGKCEKLFVLCGLCFIGSSLLKVEICCGFEYFDCVVDDVCLVVFNVIFVCEYGVYVYICICCVSVCCSKGFWYLYLECSDGSLYLICVCVLVNVVGFWVVCFIQDDLKQKLFYGICLIQGSYIIVLKLYEGEYVYILQNEDCCIVFVIFYLDCFIMIGIIDCEYQGDLVKVVISEEEIVYLL